MVGSSIKFFVTAIGCLALAISTSACTRQAKLQVGEEARRLNEISNRKQLANDSSKATATRANEFAARNSTTIHQSIALAIAANHKRRSKIVKKNLKNGSLDNLAFENLPTQAKRWSTIGGGGAIDGFGSQRQQRRERAWAATNLALAYTRVGDKAKAAEDIAAEALLLEAVAAFWVNLNSQRFATVINKTRRTLQDSIKNDSLDERERRNLNRLERRLFQKSREIARSKTAVRRASRAMLLPPPEMLSITYTPALFDRIVTSKIPPVKIGAKRSDRSIPRITSLLEALNTMPYLGIFAVQPSEIRPFYTQAEENLLLKVTTDVAWSLIDLRYRKKNIEAQNYTQSKNILVGTIRMLAARIAIKAYDSSLQKFSDALWRFQQQENLLLNTSLASSDDPRLQEFLQVYSIHLISAVEASQAYAESLTWSLRLALLSGYLKAPEAREAKNNQQLAQNAEKIEAQLRQTPGLIYTRIGATNARIAYGLPANRRQAIDQIIEAAVAIKANKPRAKTSSDQALPAMILPDASKQENLFEQGSSIYPQLPRPSQETNTPELVIPQRFQR